MADKLIDVNALLRGDDSMFDRSFSVVAVRHADGSPFTEANPPTRFRAYLSNGWLNGAGSNRLLGGYVMATGMRAMLGFSKSQGYPDAVAAGFDFYSFGPGGETVEIRLANKKRGGKYVYLDADIRLIAKTNVGSLTSLDDPDVAEATGQWSKMAPILGIRGIFGSLPDRDESRHLLADRLKPPSLPPLEKCIDLYKAIGFTTVCGDGIDYSASASKPVNPTLRQTVRTFADPASVDKAINHAFGQEAPGSVLVNDGGHYVFNSDFRTQDAISVTYNADMIPLETLLQGLRDAKLNGDWYLPTTLSVSLQFYSRPSSPILRRILVGAAHISHNDSGVGDVEVVLWDDRTEQLVATGRQTLHMMKAPRAALDALTGKPKKKSVNENGRVGIQGGNAASRL